MIGNKPIIPRLFAHKPTITHKINKIQVIFLFNLFLYAKIFLIKEMEFVVNAE